MKTNHRYKIGQKLRIVEICGGGYLGAKCRVVALGSSKHSSALTEEDHDWLFGDDFWYIVKIKGKKDYKMLPESALREIVNEILAASGEQVGCTDIRNSCKCKKSYMADKID